MAHLPRKFVDDRTPISAKDFGAKGDGATNDTAALTAALAFINAAGGGTLYLPPGVYILGSKVIFTPNNTTIRGEVGTTIVRAANGSDYDYMLDISPGTGLTIENVEFDANQAGRGVTTNVKGGI
ncbi:MAG TPA: glycosyl hydrolase family 28-related protein, partial [Anaerovoracaceae bacterium]|nr:glycosyl hydrolase family 28-related protein [Anaerovoracaceae bacterium]